MKNLLSCIPSVITAMIIFGIAIIYIPMETHTTEKIELTYIFVDDDGSEYTIMENGVHGAADDWSFLFEEENDDNDTKNNVKIDNNIETDDNNGNNGYLDNKDYVLDDDNLEKIINNDLNNDVKSDIEDISNIEVKDDNIQKQLNEIKDDCITPWNNVIKDGEYVLAYQQRNDVPTICNVQRRSCNEGILKGTYTQASCREDIKYEYTKIKAVSFNDKKIGEFIQTPNTAVNDSAIFNTDGKINQKEYGPNTEWDNIKNDPIVNNNTTNLTHKTHYNCKSPWGEIVGHGQFVKAYISPIGFIDQKCQVELRLCLDGTLKGNSSYKKCEYKDIIYLDYIGKNDDTVKDIPESIINNLIEKDNQGLLFNWFGKLFK